MITGFWLIFLYIFVIFLEHALVIYENTSSRKVRRPALALTSHSSEATKMVDVVEDLSMETEDSPEIIPKNAEE